jgi:hypothetical protein
LDKGCIPSLVGYLNFGEIAFFSRFFLYFCQAETRKRLGLTDLDPDSSAVPNSAKRKAGKDPAAGLSASKRSRAADSPRSADASPPPSSPEDLTPDYSDDDDVYRPPREPRPAPRPPNFTNALIRAGSRSTKDSSLDKSRGGQQAEKVAAAAATAPTPPAVVKKQPGLLLQAAGKGLLNTTPTSVLAAAAAKRGDAEFTELLRPKAPTISFGLYGGHLAIDENASSGGGIGSLLRSTAGGGGGGGGNTHAVLEEGPFVSLLSKASSR